MTPDQPKPAQPLSWQCPRYGCEQQLIDVTRHGDERSRGYCSEHLVFVVGPHGYWSFVVPRRAVEPADERRCRRCQAIATAGRAS